MLICITCKARIDSLSAGIVHACGGIQWRGRYVCSRRCEMEIACED
jgi:hypothetical protein